MPNSNPNPLYWNNDILSGQSSFADALDANIKTVKDLMLVKQADEQDGGWKPSTWKPGQKPTPRDEDRSHMPWPTAAQIDEQRQKIYANLKKYGYQIPPGGLSDQTVLTTMTNLPLVPHKWPEWVEDYIRRHANDPDVEPPSAGRPGVDLPTNQTYDEDNLRTKGLNPARPVGIGYAYDIPRAAIKEKFGQGALDQMDAEAMLRGSTPGALTDFVTDTMQMTPGDTNPLVTTSQSAALKAASEYNRSLGVPRNAYEGVFGAPSPNALPYSTVTNATGPTVVRSVRRLNDPIE